MAERLIQEFINANRQKKKPLARSMVETIAKGLRPSTVKQLNTDLYFASRLKIKNKAGKVVPFVMNKVQHHFVNNMTGRDLVIKARQQGLSTVIQGLMFEAVDRQPGISGVTIANEGDNTTHMVDIFNRYYEHYPLQDRPTRVGRYPNGIRFPDRNSIVYMGTAGNRTWGRSKTVHKVHGSEVAYWPDAKGIMDGLGESVPHRSSAAGEDTFIILETTANGAGGFFYDEVQKSLKGLSGWKTHFYPWWWSEEYFMPLAGGESIKYSTEEAQLVQKILKDEGVKLSDRQIKWRRKKMEDLGQEFFQEYPESIHTAFLTSGRPRFDVMKLQERLNTQVTQPVFTDYPIQNKGVITYGLRIYKKPLNGHSYVIGADVAEGITVSSTGTDFSAAIVRDRVSNEQVATVHGRFSPLEFAYILGEVGKAYNTALIGVERNNHGHAVLGHLMKGTNDGKMKPYPNLYIHDDDRPGWPTTPKTRPIMLDDLELEYKAPTAYRINDEAIIGEALTFVIDEKGRAEATIGAHDDLVLADAIACQMRNRPQVQKQVVYEPVTIGDF